MNINELITAIERAYNTFSGPPQAYFEIPINKPYEEPNYYRITYVTVNTAMKGSADHTEAALCGWLHSHLIHLLTPEELNDGSVTLIWRAKPRLVEFYDAKGCKCTAIYARLAIPGQDLYSITCVEGAQPRFL